MAKVIYEKDAEEYVLNLAEALKEVPEFEVPEWIHFVKSGSSRERPPFDSSSFWYIRSASILRQLYIHGVVGVGKLRVRYGSRKNRGGMPSEFRKAGGKIIRTILQQSEKAGFVEKVNRFQHGRRLTEKGKNFLDSLKIKEKQETDYNSLKIEKSPDYGEMEEDGKQES